MKMKLSNVINFIKPSTQNHGSSFYVPKNVLKKMGLLDTPQMELYILDDKYILLKPCRPVETHEFDDINFKDNSNE